ncbi:MAG: hypothetical protein ACE5GX_04165 [Thermoanaerobaculia bacterium]
MPYREPDPQDPHELVGVTVPGDRESMREMAATFAEEFAALGFNEDRLLDLFRKPQYAGAHRAYRELGEVEVRRIVAEALEVWGRFRVVVQNTDSLRTGGPQRLVQIGQEATRNDKEQIIAEDD